ALATPALPLAVSGRTVAVALLVAGLAVLAALMIWILERGGGRGAREHAAEGSWDGVRQAALSTVGEGDQRAALVDAARGSCRVVGFLAVTWGTYVTGVADDARSVLALLAAHAALVVERTELERSARTDALTGLLNRRAFEDELRREMSRATRMRVPLTVAL